LSSHNPLQADAGLRRTLIPQHANTPEEPAGLAARLLGPETERRGRLLTAYALFADLLNLERDDGHDRAGVLHSIDGLAELLDVACDVADMHPFDKKLWLRALDEFREDLLRYDGEGRHRKPALKKLNVIAFYLEETRRELLKVEAAEGVPNRWRQLCVAGYYATRIAVDHRSTPDADKQASRAADAARAIHAALLRLPAEVWADGSYRTRIEYGAVTDAFNRSYVRQELSWSTARQQRRISTRLLQGKPYRYRNTGKRGGGGAPGEDDPPLDLEGVEQDQWADQKREQTDEGASPDEFELPGDTPTERTSPPGGVNNTHGLYPAGETPSWARSRLTAEGLGMTLAWLRQRAKQDPDNLRLQLIYAFVYLQVTYGFRTKDLLDARHGDKLKGRHRQPKRLPILFADGILHISPRRQDAKPSFGAPRDEPALYLASSRTLTLPAPNSIAAVLDRLHRMEIPSWVKLDHLFVFRDEKGRWRPLDAETINTELKSPTKAKKRKPADVEPESLSDVLGEPVDLDRISRSAATLLIEYVVMDRLTAALVRGFIPRHLASQAFYTNLSFELIGREHIAAARKLFGHVAEQSREWAVRLGIAPLVVNMTGRRASAAPTVVAANDGRVGSPFVPQAEGVRRYLMRLREAINGGGDWRLSFNRFTAYSTLVLMFLTGLRPVELRHLTDERAALEDSQPTLAVLAKMNLRHSEWRTLELAPLVSRQLAAYKHHAKRVRKKLVLECGRNVSEVEGSLQNALLFFIRKSYLPLPVKPTTLKEQLRNGNLELDDFAWKTNAPRHNYRSTAMRLRVPSKTIDALMGHLTRGSEALGCFAMLDRADESRYAELLATHIAAELGIEFAESAW
jgi:hypothetical protein